MGVIVSARAIWKGILEFGSVKVPVKLYAGAQDRTVRLRLLHDRDKAPVKQQLVSASDELAVPISEIRKAAPVAPGRFVVLTDEELASVEPEDRRTIEMVRFVPVGVLEPAFFNRPYWLGPDGASEQYWALAQALKDEQLQGIARWVMRKRAYTGVLRARDDHLVLSTTRHVGEIVDRDAIDSPSGRAPEPRERQMARQLVAALEGPFEPEQYRDEYRDRVLDLVKRKARGNRIRLPHVRVKRGTGANLALVLKRSLATIDPAPAHRKQKAHV